MGKSKTIVETKCRDNNVKNGLCHFTATDLCFPEGRKKIREKSVEPENEDLEASRPQSIFAFPLACNRVQRLLNFTSSHLVDDYRKLFVLRSDPQETRMLPSRDVPTAEQAGPSDDINLRSL
jgi:hypothetical protein